MDKATDENQPHTINSSLEHLRPSGLTQAQEAFQDRSAKAILLARLAIHYYRPDFTEAHAKLLVQDYLEDLAEFSVSQVELGIKEYRRDAKSKFFPTVGQLISILKNIRHEQIKWADKKTAVQEFGESRPHFWWHQSRKLWRPHWRESEIPAAHREQYDRIQAKRRGVL